MTHLFTKTLLTAGISALLAGLTLSAQNLKVAADIPFAFHAEGNVLPAGHYELSQKTSPGIFQITNRAARTAQFVNASVPQGTTPTNSNLTFECYGHDCVLSSISVAGATTSYGVSRSTIEKSLSRKLGLATMIAVPLRAR